MCIYIDYYVYILIDYFCIMRPTHFAISSSSPCHLRQEVTIPGARARREGEKVQLCFDTQHLGISTKRWISQ